MNLKEYVVYKSELFVCLGTITECAQHMDVLLKMVRYYTIPAYQRELAKRKISIKVSFCMYLKYEKST
ncbi:MULTISPECIES: hypothetical protein [Bacillus cereus group]|uniref:hypothetical protein n=1 Tax=Bacillus cereus group TaxID=86661 RepID=UPI001CFAC3C8|nr:hypothetical protein [Bacillus thuringiensis]MDA1636008.1 hypothetical protein [Bacillus cereus]